MTHDTPQKPKRDKRITRLIALCWIVYACSYIGKLSFNANLHPIGLAYGASYAEVGMISTFFFFAYGAGQIVNGLLCKHYPIRTVIFVSLLVASAMNLAVVLAPSFAYLKFFWLVNGVALSFLWTSLIRLLSETLPAHAVPKAVVVMGTTVATGTFAIYGMSALFTAIATYRITFYIAAGVLAAVSLLWVVCYKPLVRPLREEREAERKNLPPPTPEQERKTSHAIVSLVVVLAFFAVANNFVRDGLTSWMPDILATLYRTPDWLSILLTLLLPVLSVGGTVIALLLQRLVKEFVATCTILFCAASALLGIVLACLSHDVLPVTVGGFAIVSCLMASVNNIITSMVPLHLKDSGNSGMLAGVLNGFCYLGSTASAYGLGAIADGAGWQAVFYTLLGVGCAVALIGIVTCTVKRICKQKTPNC